MQLPDSERIRQLEQRVVELETQAKIVRFIGGGLILAIIGLFFRVVFGGVAG